MQTQISVPSSAFQRYDVEWKDVNIVGDSEAAVKNAVAGACMVICTSGERGAQLAKRLGWSDSRGET